MTRKTDQIEAPALALAAPERADQEPLTTDPELLSLAQRLFWWQGPVDALRDSRRFLCQLMALGTWEDVQTALRHWTVADFIDALQHATPGVFDPRSWHYWHQRLCSQAAPPLPVRHLP